MIKNKKLTIWGRDFDLEIDYDNFEDGPPTEQQINALDGFLGHLSWIDASKEYVEKYCKKAVDEDTENEKKNNIFSYIKPKYIFVKKEKKEPRVAIMCNYRYEPEHGLAIVFTSEGKISVGIQDIIL